MASCCCRRKHARLSLRDGIENCYLLDPDEKIVLVIDYYYIISALIQYNIITNIDAEHYEAFAYVKGKNLYFERIAFSVVNMREANFFDALNKQIGIDVATRQKYAPTVSVIVDLFEWLIQNDFVKELIAEIMELKDYIIDLWTRNKTFIKNEFRALARIPFPRAANYFFYLSSPRISMVRSFTDRRLPLGADQLFFIIAVAPSEHIVALILHELLHTLLPTSDNIAHAIIELIADFEFAERFAARSSSSSSTTTNESSSHLTWGHRHLDAIRDKIRPYWDNYLGNTKQNVFTFYKEMRARFKD